MTLAEAVAILNENLHGMEGRPNIGPGPHWYVGGDWIYGPDHYDSFSAFEAIAVAEKYQRESK